MSTLTKAFVVLVTVLSIVLVALVVSFVARTQDLGDQLTAARRELDAANKIATSRQSELTAQQERAAERIGALNNQINDLTTKINDLQAKLDGAAGRVLAEQAKRSELEASLARLSAAEVQTAKLLEDLNAELKSRREQSVTQQTKLIEAADRIAQLEGQLDSLGRQVRRFSERMVAIQERNQQLEGAISQLPDEVRQTLPGVGEGDQVGPIQPDQAIAGRITQVQQAGGETLVQVNVGSNDGVEANTQFLVHRGEMFLGNLLVETVDADAAIGRMTLVQGQVQAGDQIYTGGY